MVTCGYLSSVIQLNKVFKTNRFTNIAPVLHNSCVLYTKETEQKKNTCKVELKVVEVIEQPLDKVLAYFEIDGGVVEKVSSWYLARHAAGGDLSKLQKDEALTFAPLSFALQVIEASREFLMEEVCFGASEELAAAVEAQVEE